MLWSIVAVKGIVILYYDIKYKFTIHEADKGWCKTADVRLRISDVKKMENCNDNINKYSEPLSIVRQ